MFDNIRDMSVEVKKEAPFPIQMIIWIFLDEFIETKGIEVSSLQEFKAIPNGPDSVIIKHIQEEPNYEMENIIDGHGSIENKLEFIIQDDGYKSIMMFKNEYKI